MRNENRFNSHWPIRCVILVFCVLAAVAIAGAGASKSTLKHSIIPVSGSQLTIILDDLPSGASWYLGARSDPAQKDRFSIAAGEMTLTECPECSSSPAPQVSDRLGTSIQVNDAGSGLVHVNGLRKLAGATLIYLIVPAHFSLSIKANEHIITAPVGSDGLLVHNGILQPQRVSGFHSILVRALAPQAGAQVPDIVPISAGFAATPSGLKSHITVFQPPANPAPSSTQKIRINLKIIIDATGRVIAVDPAVEGPSIYSTAAEQALRQWTFRPFTASGKPVQVTALIPFDFGPNGLVRSPFF